MDLPLDSPLTKATMTDTVRADTSWRHHLVWDRYGEGGMITLDSLERRYRPILFSTSKSLPHLISKDEWAYLDSLPRTRSPKKP